MVGVRIFGLSLAGTCIWWRKWVDQSLKTTHLILTYIFHVTLPLNRPDSTKAGLINLPGPASLHYSQSKSLRTLMQLPRHLHAICLAFDDTLKPSLLNPQRFRRHQLWFASATHRLSLTRGFLDSNTLLNTNNNYARPNAIVIS